MYCKYKINVINFYKLVHITSPIVHVLFQVHVTITLCNRSLNIYCYIRN